MLESLKGGNEARFELRGAAEAAHLGDLALFEYGVSVLGSRQSIRGSKSFIAGRLLGMVQLSAALPG